MRAAALGVAIVCLATPPGAAGSERWPYRLALAVDYDRQPGPESWREELELLVIDHLQANGCYESVVRFDPDASGPAPDLLLVAHVSNVEEQQRYDVAQSELYDPDAPPDTRNQYTVELMADFAFELRKLPERVTLRDKRMRLSESYRPRLNEDPRYEVRLGMIERVERALLSLACKGSEKKLQRDIDRALEEAAGSR